MRNLFRHVPNGSVRYISMETPREDQALDPLTLE